MNLENIDFDDLMDFLRERKEDGRSDGVIELFSHIHNYLADKEAIPNNESMIDSFTNNINTLNLAIEILCELFPGKIDK